jgi:Kef-type K+ transport system membrane component KefB
MPHISTELAYIGLIFGLLVAPRALQRFMIPAPLSCFALGMVAARLLPAGHALETLSLLATLGISSLFLFAGLEIDLPGLRRGLGALAVHLVLRALVLTGGAWLGMEMWGLAWQAAALVSLALLTPSTGFILESLPRLGLDDQERFWVTSKAIGGEMLALIVLFAVLQSDSTEHLAVSSAELLAMLVGLPLLFMALGRIVIPYAPGSEFSLLVMVGLLAAYLTKQIGVYYLVGAFIAGLVARLLRERMPALASNANLNAVKLFASFFVPFYFFHNGMEVPDGALQWASLQIGLALTAAVLPLRVGLVWVQRRALVRESARNSLRVAVALAPTLIFTLVLATILRERYGLPDAWYGGLLVYAALTTMLPSLTLARSFSLDISEFDAAPGARPEALAVAAAPAPEFSSTGGRGPAGG